MPGTRCSWDLSSILKSVPAMGKYYWKSAKQEKDCSERSWWDCLGVGIVQVGQEEKYTAEGPQVGRKRGLGTRDFKTEQTGGRDGSLWYQTSNLGRDG